MQSCLVFALVLFNSFSIAISLLGEERAGPCAFRASVCFVRVGVSISSSSWYQGLAAACYCGTP